MTLKPHTPSTRILLALSRTSGSSSALRQTSAMIVYAGSICHDSVNVVSAFVGSADTGHTKPTSCLKIVQQNSATVARLIAPT